MKEVPPRVLARPDPDAWGEDELMTLPEAAALFWPRGPLSTSTLRTAIRDGVLPVAVVARKFFVTRRAVRSLGEAAPQARRQIPTGQQKRFQE